MHLPVVSRIAILIGLLFSGLTLAAESMVTISAPTEGATLDAMTENVITYEVVPGPKGDHSHLYVDDKEDAVLRKLKGSYPLPTLTAGEHNICIKVVNKGHVPIGVEKCVKVMVQ